MKKIKATKLMPGMNIGVVALSTPATHLNGEFRKRAYQRIREHLGLNIFEAPNIDTVTGHAAGTPIERARSVNRFFQDKNIHGIISFWGGLNTNHVLEHLDYDLIRNNPKVLIGYSDTTALLTAVQVKTGLITFNGPAVISFAKPEILQQTLEVFKALTMSSNSSFNYPHSKKTTSNPWWQNDQFEYQPNPGVQIFKHGIVENETVGTIDRYLTQMRLMGIFDQIKGLVVGRMPEKTKVSPEIMKSLLKNALKGYSIPTMYEFDFGHTDPLSTIPIGAKMRLNTRKKELMVLENTVR